MNKTALLMTRLFEHPRPDDVAIEHTGPGGEIIAVTYRSLLDQTLDIARRLSGVGARGESIALLSAPGPDFVAGLLGIFLSGRVAVPLSPVHTHPELAHAVGVAGAVHALATPAFSARLSALCTVLPLGAPGDTPVTTASLPGPRPDDPAVMLFTSGTTGAPKGVVTSHAALAATLCTLDHAWGWRREDRLLHVLPLYHTHGLIVALLGALWAGATVRFSPFDPVKIFRLFAQVTVFMAVPTIHARLACAHKDAAPSDQKTFTANARALRLITSGSAALSPGLFETLETITGQAPLERYGMTEIGMALGNALDGPRIKGAVGREFPGVHIDLVTDDGRPAAADEPGELRVRSPQMFSAYHGDPQGTAAAFDDQGRFKTGDTGVRDPNGVFRLLGRTSVDVLKSGGYKLSALEIEQVLSDHPAIAEIAVIGLPDEIWGDRVTACIVLAPQTELQLPELRTWGKDRLAPYKIPRDLRVLATLPRNAMGKVMKGILKKGLNPGPT